jgi:hypothetical protein
MLREGHRVRGHAAQPRPIIEPMKREGRPGARSRGSRRSREIGAKLRALRAQHGGESIAHWIGAAAGVNVITPLVRGAAFEALGSHAMYGNASLDCTNKFRVCEDMYGSPFRLPFPDVDHSRFLMFLGANPAVSGTSLFHLPHAGAAAARGRAQRRARRVHQSAPHRDRASRASRSSSARHRRVLPRGVPLRDPARAALRSRARGQAHGRTRRARGAR